jgi:hypothetical protein
MYIASPRPLWSEPDIDETCRSVTIGGNSGGIKLYMNKKGLYINGYYAGLTEGLKYANTRDFLFISWEDFDKLRSEAMRGKPAPKEIVERKPDKIEKPDEEYLENLPIVTLNGMKFYIDLKRQERRPVDAPERVFNFEKQAAAEVE